VCCSRMNRLLPVRADLYGGKSAGMAFAGNVFAPVASAGSATGARGGDRRLYGLLKSCSPRLPRGSAPATLARRRRAIVAASRADARRAALRRTRRGPQASAAGARRCVVPNRGLPARLWGACPARRLVRTASLAAFALRRVGDGGAHDGRPGSKPSDGALQPLLEALMACAADGLQRPNERTPKKGGGPRCFAGSPREAGAAYAVQ